MDTKDDVIVAAPAEVDDLIAIFDDGAVGYVVCIGIIGVLPAVSPFDDDDVVGLGIVTDGLDDRAMHAYPLIGVDAFASAGFVGYIEPHVGIILILAGEISEP